MENDDESLAKSMESKQSINANRMLEGCEDVEQEEEHKNVKELTASGRTIGASLERSNSTGDNVNAHVLDENELLLLPRPSKSDKAVCTNDTLEDLQRALTYEAVFSSLLEKKVLAMKHDCEERKRAKRMKRKSLGRIFFAKKLFGNSQSSRKSSICGKPESEVSNQNVPGTLTSSSNSRRAHPRTRASESQVMTLPSNYFHSDKMKKTRSVDEIEAAAASALDSHRMLEKIRSKTKDLDTATIQKADQTHPCTDESVASTLSNSSDKYSNGGITIKRNLLVRAQTHTQTIDSTAMGAASSSSSLDSKENIETPRRSHRSNNGNGAIHSASLPYDTASLPSAYENAVGGGDRQHSSTMADDSLTSMRDENDDSIASLSFASSRYTVSFGGTEIIPAETASLLQERERERARLSKRLRILEAKSISAQCSPIFPRHLKTAETVLSPAVATAAITTTTMAQTNEAQTQTNVLATRKPFLPNQVSYTESLNYGAGVGNGDGINIDAAYLRYFSRQNTSEDSANLTVSTLLNQSDTISLHLPPSYASSIPSNAIAGTSFDRYKSKSTTSLLMVQVNARTRPPPPTFGMTLTTPPTEIPTALATANITSNLGHNLETHLVDSLSKSPAQTSLSTHKRQDASYDSVESLPQLNITTVSSTLQYYHPVITSVETGGTSTGIERNTIAATTQLDSEALLSSKTIASAYRNGVNIAGNGAIVTSSSHVHDETAKLNRMTSTSTGSSVAPTGCCTTMKSSSRDRDKDREKDKDKDKDRQQYHQYKASLNAGQSGSDDEYRRRKRKYKRYHRCSDPVLVYPTPSGLQHCILSIPPSDPIQFSYGGDFAYDMQIQMESDKIVVGAVDDDDLEEMVPSGGRRHRRHRHHRHKKRHRHKKPKILVQDLETQVVKVIDPDDLPQRARWTIIATACLLLIMCLMLVGITLRMAPIIDDMVRQENERLMKETMERAKFGKNFTDTASLIGSRIGNVGIISSDSGGISSIGNSNSILVSTTVHLNENAAHIQQQIP